MVNRIVLTGGPSAGKTTLLTLLGLKYKERVAVAAEAATIHFSNGEVRPFCDEERILTQRKIFKLQRWLESQAEQNAETPVFCDRGSLDGSAYWPGSVKEFCFAMNTTLEHELSRYTAVIHLQSAAIGTGYVNNSIRQENRDEAALLDQRITDVWRAHPHYIFVPNSGNFVQKLDAALLALKPYLPTTLADERAHAKMYSTVSDLLAQVSC